MKKEMNAKPLKMALSFRSGKSQAMVMALLRVIFSSSGAELYRLRRFRRDLSRSVNWGAWIPGILGPTAISVGWLWASALQTESIKNQLLIRFAQERVNQAAQSLSAETKDYAIWDETFGFLKGANPDYISKNFNLGSEIRFKDRQVAVPHDGYRAFDNSNLFKLFPDLTLQSWEMGIKKLCLDVKSIS
jgi:hypothetical protein